MLSRWACRRRRILDWSSVFCSKESWAAQESPTSRSLIPRFYFTKQCFGISRKNPISPCVISITQYSSQAWINLPTAGIVEVPLAQTGEGIAECELLRWYVKEGDFVDEFERLCEVQSDKATIEITSRYKGKVSEILFNPGDIVKVGETLLKMLVENADADNVDSALSEDGSIVGSTSQESSFHEQQSPKEKVGEVLATPRVRHLAKEYGFDMHDIPGSGIDGRILKEDVVKYALQKGLVEVLLETSQTTVACDQGSHYLHEPFPTTQVSEPSYEDKNVLLRGYQRAMVKSMSLAVKVPHFHYLEEIHCDAILKLKESFQKENKDQDVKHTFLPFLIKSLSLALTEYPILNSTFREESMDVVYKGCHNVGVAMATPSGLVVPNIKKVQSLTLLQITKELSRLQKLAICNKLPSEDVSGGTITLSNIGAIGGKFGSPLVNLPEVAIIAIGRIQKLPRFADDGTLYPASVMNVTVGADHRVVDGATVARFCNEWKHFIEKPELLMLHTR